MGKGVKVDWQESSEELKQLYQKEVHPQRRTRLQAFWQLSQGKRIQDVVDTTGASYRSMEQWLRWYRRGGLGEVLRRVVGHQAKGKKPYLNPLQQRAPWWPRCNWASSGRSGMQRSGSGDAGGCVIPIKACIPCHEGAWAGVESPPTPFR